VGIVQRRPCTSISWTFGPGYLSRYSDSLLSDHSEVWIPMGERISAPVQTGPGAHPVSCTRSTRSLFPGIKRPGRYVDHPLPIRITGIPEKRYGELCAIVVSIHITFTKCQHLVPAGHTYRVRLCERIKPRIKIVPDNLFTDNNNNIYLLQLGC